MHNPKHIEDSPRPDDSSIKDYLDRIAEASPSERHEGRDDWRLIEARRMEALYDDDLRFEAYGY